MGQKKIDFKKLIKESINKYLNEEVLCESLNNFDYPLYHNTETERLLDIMKTNSLISNYHQGYSDGKKHSGICFTRSKTFYPYEYSCVRMTFDADKLRNVGRGLRLVSYKDPRVSYLDEYEERLISVNGEPFTINNINQIVSEVVIVLDRVIDDMTTNGYDIETIENELAQIDKNNIFGNKLKFVNNLNSMTVLDLYEACIYLEENSEAFI